MSKQGFLHVILLLVVFIGFLPTPLEAQGEKSVIVTGFPEKSMYAEPFEFYVDLKGFSDSDILIFRTNAEVRFIIPAPTFQEITAEEPTYEYEMTVADFLKYHSTIFMPVARGVNWLEISAGGAAFAREETLVEHASEIEVMLDVSLTENIAEVNYVVKNVGDLEVKRMVLQRYLSTPGPFNTSEHNWLHDGVLLEKEDTSWTNSHEVSAPGMGQEDTGIITIIFPVSPTLMESDDSCIGEVWPFELHAYGREVDIGDFDRQYFCNGSTIELDKFLYLPLIISN